MPTMSGKSHHDASPKNRAYQAALDFLYGRVNYERVLSTPYSARQFKLDRMRELSQRLGCPDAGLPIVHIAGTKGKGSTASLIASIATSAGLRTGVFSSPHLHRIEERLAIDAEPASAQQLVELVEVVRPVVEAMDRCHTQEGGPTYFEITTAMALCHFARQRVDLAVLEVGLGGRLDSTNICQPKVAVITSISFDHMAQLGDTLEQIAFEKAGIVKPSVPVISGVAESPAREVIARRCAECDAPLWQVGRDFHFEYFPPRLLDQQASMARVDVEIAPTHASYRGLEMDLIGRHQAANAATALATIEQLRQQGWSIAPEAIRLGMRRARCPARIEVIQRKPTVVVDGAHNEASIEALVRTLDESFAKRCKWLVFAAGQDKDIRGMLTRILPCFDQVVFTRYQTNPRSVAPEQLAACARSIGTDERGIHVCSTPLEAWQIARRGLRDDDLLCVTGSFFIAGEFRRLLQEASFESSPAR